MLHNRHAQDLRRRTLRVWIGTWNCANTPPPDDLSPWLPPNMFDLYVIGSQVTNCDALVM